MLTPVFLEYLGWEEIIKELNVMHQQAGGMSIAIHPRMVTKFRWALKLSQRRFTV